MFNRFCGHLHAVTGRHVDISESRKVFGAIEMSREALIKNCLIFAMSLFLLAFTLGPFMLL